MAALLLSMLLGLAGMQPVTIDPPPAPSPEEILDTGEDRVARMTVDVRVNDAGPFAFVVDTAATRSVVSTPLAALLALPAAGPVILHGIAGPETVSTVRIARLGVGTGGGKGIVAPVLARRGIGADGLLGIDALADRRVTLDFRAQTMTVSPSITKRPPDPPGTIVVTARRRFGQLILTNATVDGRKVFAVIDTGAENSVGNLALQRRVRRGEGRPGLLVGVTGRTVIADMAVLPQLTIGGVRIQNVPVAFADIHSFRRFGLLDDPAILIGMDVLRAFDRVTIDFGRRSVRFGVPRDGSRQNSL